MTEFDIKRFKNLCRVTGWTQARLAAEWGIHPGNLFPIFSGARKPGCRMIGRFQAILPRIEAEAHEIVFGGGAGHERHE